jgi:hypothetical protein
VLDDNCKLFKSWKKKFMIGTWTSKQEEENQGSSDEKETECDSVMLRTFHHACILVASSVVT